MFIDLTIRNYRCFGREQPARLELRPGFTAFVGPNNGGKSTVLKFFWELRPLFSALDGSTANYMQAVGGVHQPFSTQLADPDELFSDWSDGDLEIEVRIRQGERRARPPLVDRVIITIPRNSQTYRLDLWVGSRHVGPVDHWNGNRPEDGSGKILANLDAMFACFRSMAATFLVGPLRTPLTAIGGSNYDLEVGGSLVQRWRNLKTGTRRADRHVANALVEELAGLFRLGGLGIEVSEDGRELIATINGRSYSFDELGSGLGHFAVALTNIATRKGAISYVLVDEPENGLHPTLQLQFLTTLGSRAPDGVLFATHSYGLARRASQQISTVGPGVQGRASFVTELEEQTSLAEFLGELGYAGFVDLGFQGILLVEGSTDVPAVEQLLRAYQKGGRLVLLPLGGASMINAHAEGQLAEILRLSKRVTALIDSERLAPDAPLSVDRGAIVKSCQKLGIECHVLERRAIENYFPKEAIATGVGSQFQELEPHARLADATAAWAKADNWRITKEISPAQLENTDLGRFLHEL